MYLIVYARLSGSCKLFHHTIPTFPSYHPRACNMFMVFLVHTIYIVRAILDFRDSLWPKMRTVDDGHERTCSMKRDCNWGSGREPSGVTTENEN